ncbi:hypothetical protein F8388_015128 [Cannabis sativa]|uniref:UspA domain-containing protein n=1 Tax=Cannabis sativa TaxID=3483 RepID=A0A7J6ER16_CANSA|nr:hypothetical protein F8388_015128 [Cannabis sativa]
MEKKKVMVAIDESDCSHYALQWALDNLHHTILDSKLVIFTVQSTVDLGYIFASSYGSARTSLSLSPELVVSIQERNKKVAVALLEKATEICSKHQIEAETLTEVGDPKEKICEAVDKFNIQLLVIGSHGRGTIQRALLGSLIMVGIDESELSYDALIWVLENLKESFKDNHLFIFATQSLTTAVLPSLGLAHFHFHLSPTMDLISQNQQQNMKISLGLLEKSKRICAKHGVKVKTFTEGGDPKMAICKAVEEHNIDLLVLGQKSKGIIERALLGSSLSDYCLSNAKCPVLVVKKT